MLESLTRSDNLAHNVGLGGNIKGKSNTAEVERITLKLMEQAMATGSDCQVKQKMVYP